jgi:uncharacterized membrane protein
MLTKQHKILHTLVCTFLMLGFINHYTPYKHSGATELLFLAAMALHSYMVWGAWRTVTYIIIAPLLGYTAEFIGVHTGHIFGAYTYNSNLPGLIFGVPFFVPIGYAYLAYSTNFLCLAISKPMAYKRNVLILAVMSGFILTMHDLSIDPLWSTVHHLWTWDKNGAIYGVPLHNFLGWFFVFATITIVASLSTWHVQDRCRHLVIRKSILVFPILLFIAFSCFGLTDALFTTPPNQQYIGDVCAFISLFGLSPYIILAWFNGLRTNPDQ